MGYIFVHTNHSKSRMTGEIFMLDNMVNNRGNGQGIVSCLWSVFENTRTENTFDF